MLQEDDLGALVGYRLKQAQSVLRARMDETLRELGLSTPQYICLELLSRQPGASNSDLARGAFVTRQTMNTLLRGLQRRGLIERAEQAATGRVLPTKLTESGRQLLDLADESVQQIENRTISLLDAEKARALHEALGLCIEALSEPNA
ncbi:MarR family winged helix-turn-helix transcriptional regulator [Paramicrobacterium fandaimingii]|uniref:MarR family winged helix-turn-helix transcriptional regulator n=1 Tax=Paramicrobacterium fandaimingii TaxID=2708079 RepID=UPI0018A012B8|nr:MarR family transcriptional regulator [Microbacterium fandaimingii]